jgi:GNAT superfamily N-acetyltransferase
MRQMILGMINRREVARRHITVERASDSSSEYSGVGVFTERIAPIMERDLTCSGTESSAKRRSVPGFAKWLWTGLSWRCRGIAGYTLSLQRTLIFTFDLKNRPLGVPHASCAAVEFSVATPQILRGMMRDPDLGMAWDDGTWYGQFVSGQNRLLIATSGSQIVCYGGVVFGSRPFWNTESRFLLRDDEFFILACFTRPAYRGRGLYRSLLSHMCDELRGQGYRTGYIDIAAWNKPSIRGALKAGAVRHDSQYLRIRLLGRNWIIPRGSMKDRFE